MEKRPVLFGPFVINSEEVIAFAFAAILFYDLPKMQDRRKLFQITSELVSQF